MYIVAIGLCTLQYYADQQLNYGVAMLNSCMFHLALINGL